MIIVIMKNNKMTMMMMMMMVVVVVVVFVLLKVTLERYFVNITAQFEAKKRESEPYNLVSAANQLITEK